MKLLAHGFSAPRVHDHLHPLRPVTRWLTGLGRRAFARVFLHRFTRGSVLAQLG